MDTLIPRYLDEVPADPFDGKALRMTHSGEEWIVYSIGPDQKDDGGAPFDSRTKKGDLRLVLPGGE